MKKIHWVLPLLCTAPLLQSCESSMPKQAWSMQPVLRLQNSDESASGYYQLGRYYQGQSRTALAMSAFQKALAVDSQYAEAHNALGALYAAQGQYDQAIAQFKQAMTLSPNSAHFLNNLAYTYYLQGRYAEAAAVYDQASALNPADAKIANNRSLALAKLEQSPHPAPTLVAANASQPSDDQAPPTTKALSMNARETKPAPLPVVDEPGVNKPAEAKPLSSPPVPLPTTAPATATATVEATPQPSTVAQHQPPNQVEEHGLPSKVDTVAQTETPQEAITSPQAQFTPRFEVSNGNGVTGMARRVSQALIAHGYPKARLTNQKPFQQPVTLVEYRQGFAAEAERVSTSLPAKPMIKQRNSLRSSTDIRLVLGKDVAYNIALVKPDQEAALRLASK